MSEDQNPVEFETTDIKKPKVKRGRGRMGMNLKSLLTAFIIVGIGALLLTTKSGKNFAGRALDSVKIGVGNFVSGLFSGDFKWELPFGQKEKMPSGEQFLMSILVAKDAFYGQQYSVTNTSLELEGLCDAVLSVGDIMLKTESMECSIAAEYMKGTFEYTIAGTVRFDGEVSSLEVDGNIYTSTEGMLTVSFEVLPIDFVLVGLTEREIIIPLATGSINRMTPAGAIKSTEGLEGERIEIGGFVGFIKLEDSNIKLQGLAVSVHGQGPYSSFSW